jgi:hypothetical protein
MYGNGDGRWATRMTTGAEMTTQRAATTTKETGSPPPPPPPVAITSGPDKLLQYSLCIAVSARGHSGSASSRKKDQVPFLIITMPPLVRLRLPPLIRLSFALMAGCRVTFFALLSPCVARHHFLFTQRMAPSPLPLLHCCCAVHHRHHCVAIAPSIAPVAR